MNCITVSQRSFQRLAAFSTLALAVAFGATSASALTINPTYGSTGGAGSFSAADMNDIQAAINLYQATFTDPITVNITFQNMSSGLGQSSTPFFSDTYANVHNRLIADATTADDTAALAQLLASPPVADGTSVDFSEANAKAIGYTGFGSTPDSTIGLNASLCFNVHNLATATANPTKYDLFAVACHEMDEALGSVSDVGGTDLDIVDFYRYNGNSTGTLSGGRSFTSSTGVHAWFSINGTTALDEYNQFNRSGGDFGDWVAHNPGQVQDWAGSQGQLIDPNVELRLLDVVGYNRAAVPEPASLAALGLGIAVLVRRRKKN